MRQTIIWRELGTLRTKVKILLLVFVQRRDFSYFFGCSLGPILHGNYMNYHDTSTDSMRLKSLRQEECLMYLSQTSNLE